MKSQAVMAVLIKQRTEEAPSFQEIITRHGCIIRTRVGIHEVDNVCAEDGLIILHLRGDQAEIDALGNEINQLTDVRAKWMMLDF